MQYITSVSNTKSRKGWHSVTYLQRLGVMSHGTESVEGPGSTRAKACQRLR